MWSTSRLLLVSALALVASSSPAAAEAQPDPDERVPSHPADPVPGSAPSEPGSPAAAEPPAPDAQEPNEGFARTGGYFGVFGVGALEDLKGELDASKDAAWGLGLRAGIRGHRNVALELGFEWIEGFDVKGDSQDVDGYAVTVNGRFFLVPGSGRLQPYALVGIGWGEYEVELDKEFNQRRDNFVARFGGGLELYLTDHLALTFDANYLLGTGDVNDVRYTSLAGGLLGRF